MRFTTLQTLQFQRPVRGRFSRASTATTPCTLTSKGIFATQQECLAATSCGWKYKCATDGACLRAADGAYDTQEGCFAQCSRFGCDGTGQCVPQEGGPYASLADCKCYDCVNNQCAPVAAKAQGAYPTLAACQDDSQKQCGWKYDCSVATQLPIQAGQSAAVKVGSWCTPAFGYFPMSQPFYAYTANADVTVTGVTATVSGGSTNSAYLTFAVVVAAFGNYAMNALDPTPKTFTSPIFPSGCAGADPNAYPLVNVGANVVATTDKVVRQGSTAVNGTVSNIATFSNRRVQLVPGYQYQVFLQVYSQADNLIGASWTGGSVSIVA